MKITTRTTLLIIAASLMIFGCASTPNPVTPGATVASDNTTVTPVAVTQQPDITLPPVKKTATPATPATPTDTSWQTAATTGNIFLPTAGTLSTRLPDYQDYYSPAQKGNGQYPSVAYKQFHNPYEEQWQVQRCFYNGASADTLTAHPPTQEMNTYWENIHVTGTNAKPGNWNPSYYVRWELRNGQWVLAEGGRGLIKQAPTPVPVKVDTTVLSDAAGVTVEEKTDGSTSITLSEEAIRFDVDKADLKPAAYPILGKVLAILLQSQGKVQVIGHTDSDASDVYNMKLSKRRAEAVANWLQKYGSIPADRLQIVGMGEAKPVADNSTSEGKAKNRRVEFIIP